jgi:hypothetical protein
LVGEGRAGGDGVTGTPFERVAENVDATGFQQSDRWLDCRIQNGVWNGSGDETKLAVILKTFIDWAEGAA